MTTAITAAAMSKEDLRRRKERDLASEDSSTTVENDDKEKNSDSNNENDSIDDSDSINTASADSHKEEPDSFNAGIIDADNSEAELVEPQNFGETLLFRELITNLLEPISIRSRTVPPSLSGASRSTQDRTRVFKTSYGKRRFELVRRFVEKWRRQVGPNFYPALRLCLPHRDRDRPMYNVKEVSMAKYWIKLLGISPTSQDAQLLKHWKAPGQSRKVGDFAGIVFEVLEKRPMREEWSSWTIAQINSLLDDLACNYKEQKQFKVFTRIYETFCPVEIKWLTRIILRQLKVGIGERLLLEQWHPDAFRLFNVCSSLKRVCYQLYDPNISLDDEEQDIKVFSCFMPQLAQYKERGIEDIPAIKLGQQFYIEEKLDGERVQMHMHQGKFKFFSRRARDLTSLYGDSVDAEHSALTKHLGSAFDDRVYEIILDGEMISWDPVQEAPSAFGTLREAAILEYDKKQSSDPREHTDIHPFFNVFDILYLNGHSLKNYSLHDRYKALQQVVRPVPRRLEIVPHVIASSADEIQKQLKIVVQTGSEGLVIKMPNSVYKTNERNDAWIKLKPEYMNEFGENLDILIVGGFYGDGSRGGKVSSFLCALRIDDTESDDHDPRYATFCRVGGGFNAQDYATIRGHCATKWHTWNANAAARHYVFAASARRVLMKPDVWILPEDSLIIQVKAAQIVPSDQFASNITLRFPRFQRIRDDKDHKTCLSEKELQSLKTDAEAKHNFNIMSAQRKRARFSSSRKQSKLEISQQDDIDSDYTDIDKLTNPLSPIFKDLNFHICTGMNKTSSRHSHTISKAQLEHMMKNLGGKCFQSEKIDKPLVIVADDRTMKVAMIQNQGFSTIIRPQWILDCINMHSIIPFAPEHLLVADKLMMQNAKDTIDKFGNSFFIDDNSIEEIWHVNSDQDLTENEISEDFDVDEVEELENASLLELFRSCKVFIESSVGFVEQIQTSLVVDILSAGSAKFAGSVEDESCTHVVVVGTVRIQDLRRRIAYSRERVPRIVTDKWVAESWNAQTMLSEERYLP